MYVKLQHGIFLLQIPTCGSNRILTRYSEALQDALKNLLDMLRYPRTWKVTHSYRSSVERLTSMKDTIEKITHRYIETRIIIL